MDFIRIRCGFQVPIAGCCCVPAESFVPFCCGWFSGFNRIRRGVVGFQELDNLLCDILVLDCEDIIVAFYSRDFPCWDFQTHCSCSIPVCITFIGLPQMWQMASSGIFQSVAKVELLAKGARVVEGRIHVTFPIDDPLVGNSCQGVRFQILDELSVNDFDVVWLDRQFDCNACDRSPGFPIFPES